MFFFCGIWLGDSCSIPGASSGGDRSRRSPRCTLNRPIAFSLRRSHDSVCAQSPHTHASHCVAKSASTYLVYGTSPLSHRTSNVNVCFHAVDRHLHRLSSRRSDRGRENRITEISRERYKHQNWSCTMREAFHLISAACVKPCRLEPFCLMAPSPHPARNSGGMAQEQGDRIDNR